MINIFRMLRHFFVPSLPSPRKPARAVLRVEMLEDRVCPAGTWVWNGPAMVNSNWSNPTGGNWLLGTTVAGAGAYPGMPGSTNDVVQFSNFFAGSATLDVPLGTLGGLTFAGWSGTLTFNAGRALGVSGGSFALADSSSIDLGANGTLGLLDASLSGWGSGEIIGGAMASFNVYGTTFNLWGVPAFLGVNLNIGKSPMTGLPGTVFLGSSAPMLTNLDLSGANNSITVNDGGTLSLMQTIPGAGGQDTVGGIVFGAAHAAAGVAVTVNTGGTLTRSGPANPGTINEVKIAGPVYNKGGLVQVNGTDDLLKIAGTDAANRSYWQQTNGTAQLYVQGGNINGAGTFQIDTGTVKLMVVSGATTDELDSAGLLFGNAAATALTIVDSTAGTPGTLTIQGPVTLAAMTTTTENFSGANNTADLIDVRNGALTLNGTLSLETTNPNQKPTQALEFLDDQGAPPSLLGNFATINVDIMGAVIANLKIQNGGSVEYWVAIS